MQRKLERAWQEQNEPAASSPEFLNRLILEHSPYLRQHADNPVDWFPWGEEALRRARETGRPIFLSIGYSTCYWCHVMEQESFRDPQLAHRLNSDFIPIKVDRERRPELDEYYLQAQQMLFGSVGWPVSMVLTPEAQPVFAASYLAPEAFGRFLGQVAEAWQLRRAQLERRAQKVARTLAPSRSGDPIELSSALRLGAVSALVEAADMVHGGFGRGEKFPSVNRLLLLLDAAARDHHQAAGRVALHALRAMSRGGVRDQLGGGFHRYALDRQWRRPHFEKMLYTQSSLAEALIAAVRLSGDVELAASLRDCLDFVMRGLQQPQGGFSSAVAAQDAGGEGAYYLWTRPQIAARLGPDAASLFEQFIGLAKQSPEADSGVLYQIQPAFDFARQQSWAGGEYRLWWEAQRQTLLAARMVRPVPEVDDKVILAWNARMISVMLHASEVLQARHYRDAAEKAFDFLQGELLRSDGLRRVWWRGQVSTLAQLDDYAALGLLYLDFYRLNGRPELLGSAQDLADAAWLRFVEPLREGENPDGLHESRIFPRATRDQEQPHAYALTAELFSRLASLSPGGQYKRRYQQLLAGLSRSIALQPADHTSLLRVAAEHAGGRLEDRVVAAGGHARIRLTRSPQGFDLDLELEDGWHINAHETGESLLLPTVVTGHGDAAGGLRIEYPPPLSKTLAFEGKPLWLYAGRIRIRGHRPVEQQAAMLVLRLSLQACSDSLCLPPETILLHLPAAITPW